MDTSPIPGFITRKQASERCKRAERTLQRYWSRAIELADAEVLGRLKLRTEDGEVIEGPDVTKELIDQLKKRRKNPTWYVHAGWVAKAYGPRLDDDTTDKRRQADGGVGDSHPQTPPVYDSQVISLRDERIRQLEQDKQDLREELKIKNEQIKEANERDRETHVLMRDLHELLRDMQQRLPAITSSYPPLPAATPPVQPPDTGCQQDAGAEPKTKNPKTEEPARRAPKKTSASKTTRLTKQPASKRRKKPRASKKPSGLFERHTPTFHKALSVLLRR